MKKIISYILIIFVLLLTIVTILGIWGVIDLEDLFRKIVLSLLVIFGATAVILFIYTVLLREPETFQPFDQQKGTQ